MSKEVETTPLVWFAKKYEQNGTLCQFDRKCRKCN